MRQPKVYALHPLCRALQLRSGEFVVMLRPEVHEVCP